MSRTDNAMSDGLRNVALRRMADVRDDVPTWAWIHDGRGRIAAGTLILFAGRPGAGKSTCARAFAAKITRGTLPGAWDGTPTNVAYIAREEALEFVVVPSLRAHDADLTRVFYPEVTVGSDEVPLRVDDMAALTRALKDAGVKFVVVDPLMSMLGAKTDAHRNNEVRAQLEPWSRLAEDIGGVVLGVAHLNKSGSGDVVAGITGSSAFGEVARAVFGFVKDPDSESGDRIMSQEKNSLGDESLALVYRITEAEVRTSTGKTAGVGRFDIVGASDRSAGDVLRDAGRGDAGGDDRTAAANWLQDYLTEHGTAPRKDVIAAGAAEKFALATLKRAASRLGVVSTTSGFPRVANWALPSPAGSGVPHGEPTEPTEPTGDSGVQKHALTCTDPVGSQLAHSVAGEPTGEPTAKRALTCADDSPASQLAQSAQLAHVSPEPTPPKEPTVNLALSTTHTTCVECHITLPSSVRGDRCIDCAEGGWLRPTDPADEPPTPAPKRVVSLDSWLSQRSTGVWRRSGQPVHPGGSA